MRGLGIALAATAWLLAAVPVYADVATIGSWQAAPGPALHRYSDHTATLLHDGRVLVVGGLTPNPPDNPTDAQNFTLSGAATTSAEVFDPASGRWSTTGSLTAIRPYHTATLLADGRVLVVGGHYGSPTSRRIRPEDYLSSAELYDPTSGRWSPTGSMAQGRMGHTATLLRDGRVLVAGGLASVALDTAEIYDPGTGRWSATGRMPSGRWEHTATLLDDGTVLVAGGRNAAGGHSVSGNGTPSLQDALIFEPRSGTWTTVPHLMAVRRTAHTATLLADGTVLIAGGSTAQDHAAGGIPIGTVEIYVPRTRSFIAAQPMLSARIAPSASRLPDGRVLVVGGYGARWYASQGGTGAIATVASAEVYLPSTGRWVLAGRLLAAPDTAHERYDRFVTLAGWHTATVLSGPACGHWCGRVLVIGGDDRTAAAQLFDPATGESPANDAATWRERLTTRPVLLGAGAAAALLLAAVIWRVRTRRSEW